MNKNKIFTSLNKINWKAPTKLYSPRASAPDITIEEKSQILHNKTKFIWPCHCLVITAGLTDQLKGWRDYTLDQTEKKYMNFYTELGKIQPA